MRILVISGAPGSGKSSIMQKILPMLGPSTRIKHGVLEYTQFEKVNVLGYYETGNLFGGTDRLSMSVQSSAMEFLNGVYRSDPERSIALEGDRLANSEFIKLARSVGVLRFISLRVPDGILAQRRASRAIKAGKAQNETWLRGRASKAWRLEQAFNAEVRQNITEGDLETLSNDLYAWLLGLTDTPVVESNTLF